MNIKLYKILIFLFIGIMKINAQTTNYYHTLGNEKINLTKVSGKYLAEFPNGFNVTNAVNSTNNIGYKLTDKTYIVADTTSLHNYSSSYNLTPTYITNEGQELNYTREIVLKFKNPISIASKESMISTNNISLIKSTISYDMYQINNGDALEISKNIFMSGLVEFCTPNFITKIELLEYIPNDTYFNQQWYLHNTGQGANDGKTTTVDADIDAPEAWEITKGSPDIIIAVLDEGVTSNHPDLPNTRQVRLNGSNFAYEYDGSNNPNDPSPTVSTTSHKNHGNACAGIIAATQDNNEGITGIAPLCKIMPIKLPFGYLAPISYFADGINFAVANNADILSNSWGVKIIDSNAIPLFNSAINNAINNNKSILFAIGNNANRLNGNYGSMWFPARANIDDLISVGASDRDNFVADYSPNYPDIVAPSATAINPEIGESHNIWTIDTPGTNYGYNSWKNTNTTLPAFGELLPNYGTNNTSYTGRFSGTSASTPEVAGVLALMKSVNPCLDVHLMKEVLQSTADKIGGYDYNYFLDETYDLLAGCSLELGYGKVNAYNAVKTAQEMNSSTLDLMIRDGLTDFGLQPNTSTQILWNSPDIWTRNNPDGFVNTYHENPEWQDGLPVNVYVRITNKSCVASSSSDVLKLYWSKASSSLTWPSSWDGSSTFPNGALVGGPIGTISIPVIEPGKDVILSIEWQMLNPSLYSGTIDQWHSCLLARIESDEDPMNGSELRPTPNNPAQNDPSNLVRNVKHNNNIAWKNLSIINEVPDTLNNSNTLSATIAIGNPYNTTRTYSIEIKKEDNEIGKNIYEEAEVKVVMDETLYNAWERGSKTMQRIESTSEQTKKIIKGNNAILENIVFQPNETGKLTLNFNFLTQEVSDKTQFVYHLTQRDSNTGEVLGGETYLIKKPARPIFIADAGGDKIVDQNEPITISATQISEPAIYNWYDTQGNLIFTGKDLTIATEVATKYKLEVIATADGFKDYSEVNVNLKPSILNTIIPNPATNNVTIDYKLNAVSSAYLMIIGNYGTNGTSNNYILDVNSTQTNINIENYSTGFYTVALVCDGQIVDAKLLVKQ